MVKKIYAQDGVDVALGDIASKAAFEHCKATYNNCDIASIINTSDGNFRGPRGVLLKPNLLNERFIWSCAPDGVGTKPVITDACGKYLFSAYDLLAMTSMDLIRYGGKPVYMTTVLDVSSLGESEDSDTFKAVLQLYQGLENAANEAGIIILNGETAELGSLVGSDNITPILKYNWGGSVHGLYDTRRMITGDGVKYGQVIMALPEDGFRSNGMSSVRPAFAKKFGNDWFNNPEAQEYIKRAAAPSVLYDKFFNRINGWGENPNDYIKIHSIIHLTGGSFESKLGHDVLFPKGLSAVLDDLCSIPEIMRICANWRGMNTRDIYDTWNAGQGALAIIDESSVDKFIYLAKEMKHKDVRMVGRIIKNDVPSITIPLAWKEEDIVYS